jgi:hypothetical protein
MVMRNNKCNEQTATSTSIEASAFKIQSWGRVEVNEKVPKMLVCFLASNVSCFNRNNVSASCGGLYLFYLENSEHLCVLSCSVWHLLASVNSGLFRSYLSTESELVNTREKMTVIRWDTVFISNFYNWRWFQCPYNNYEQIFQFSFENY